MSNLTYYAKQMHNALQNKDITGPAGLKYTLYHFYRMSSQISSEEIDFFNCGNTGACRINCKFWSEKAAAKWMSLEGTSAKRSNTRGEDGKTIWVVEHQYPISIFIKLAFSGQMDSVEKIEDYLQKYNKYIIILSEEDRSLPKTVKTIEEGHRRYEDAGIKIVKFSTKNT
jgi:hypothetical protein